MLSSVLHVLLLALVPIGATAIGAILATWAPPGPRVRSLVQHFAAGVVFSVVAVELLPDVVRGGAIPPVSVGFACGVAVMLLLRRLTEGAEGDESAPVASVRVSSSARALPEQVAQAVLDKAPAGMLVAVGVDILLDGILLGVAFAAGAKEGLLLTIALSVELLSLGLAMASSLLARGTTRLSTIAIVVGLSLSLAVGAVIGDTVLHNAGVPLMSAVLAFGCAALLFLVTEELLVEAHEVPETMTAMAMFFAGFLLFLILGMVS